MTPHFRVLIVCLFGALSGLAQSTGASTNPQFPSTETHKNATLSHKIIPGNNATFGYDIYSDGKLLIHQPTIPGLAGVDGFKTRAGAENAAKLVEKKIANGQMPPTVSTEELKKIKAIP
jgi:hypothetical protein